MTAPYEKALSYALSLLALRARGRKEMAEKLSGKKYEADVIDAVLVRLAELHYLDDERFAQDYFQYQLNRGKGVDAIRFDLSRKGIDPALTERLVRAYREDPAVEVGQIKDLARRKLKRLQDVPPRDAARRLTGFLARRGFSLDGIRTALRDLRVESSEEKDTIE